MVISTTAPVSEETYREIALGDPNLELHHGQLREKPGMSVGHNNVSDLLVTRLRNQLDRSEYWVRENFGRLRRSGDTYYIPDVLVIPTSLLRAPPDHPMNIQYSRGCPFNCEFCDITIRFGHKVRTKSSGQILAELESLYFLGWRGVVFFVDDNFIGNKRKLKQEILPAIIEWMATKRRPFSFITEASIDLSDDEELMQLMVKAGFDSVFLGVETPYEESLSECSKFQNKNRDLVACVNKFQKSGLNVMGGFIVGFDNDPPSIFEKQIEFIQKSGIVTAMVGLLNAPRGTRLYQRLLKENRLLKEFPETIQTFQ